MALGLSDGDSDDTFTPVGKPYAPVGRASRRHSCLEYADPTDRFSDEEAVHLGPLILLGRPLFTMILAVIKKAISPLVVRGTSRVGTSYPSVLRVSSQPLC